MLLDFVTDECFDQVFRKEQIWWSQNDDRKERGEKQSRPRLTFIGLSSDDVWAHWTHRTHTNSR